MFTTRKISEQGFEKIVLQDESNGTQAEIIPACGAMLHAFTVNNNGKRINIIDGYADAADFKANVTAKGFKSSKLSPFVCRMRNGKYHFGENDYRIEKFYLGEHAIHGLLYDAVFETTAMEADADKALVTVLHQYRGEDAGFPFHYDCLVTYTLKTGNSLAITTEVINKSGGLMPVQDGWHPYFTFGGSINDLQLEFQSKEIVDFDDGLLPTGKLTHYEDFGSLTQIGDHFFDNCFTLNFAECQPLCVLRDVQQKMQLEIHPGQSYPYLQVYTPPHRQSIAIENLSCAPDGFNNGMGVKTLMDGESALFTTTYTISLLSQAHE
jgi:aldose 1-epimerase